MVAECLRTRAPASPMVSKNPRGAGECSPTVREMRRRVRSCTQILRRARRSLRANDRTVSGCSARARGCSRTVRRWSRRVLPILRMVRASGRILCAKYPDPSKNPPTAARWPSKSSGHRRESIFQLNDGGAIDILMIQLHIASIGACNDYCAHQPP